MKIGLISDTHGHLEESVFTHFKDCDEIWHAGDIGLKEVLEKLEAFKPTLAVFGNIDHQGIQAITKEDLIFKREGMKILMTHIAGKPPTYNPRVRGLLDEHKPNIIVCGHSHILKVMPDPKRAGLLFLNPGAAGLQGFHRIKTLLRFDITAGKIANMEVIELGLRGKSKT